MNLSRRTMLHALAAPFVVTSRVETSLAAPLAPAPSASAGQGWGRPVEDLTFGADRAGATVTTRRELCERVYFYDQFGHRNNNGGNYLADNMAPPECDDPGPCQTYESSYPFHVVDGSSLICFVKPKDPQAERIVPAGFRQEQPVGASGFRLKYHIAEHGLGASSGMDLCWETRVRIRNPAPYFWWALWICGEAWAKGAELDVPESFGFDNGLGRTNFDARLFHANSVGGDDRLTAGSWTNYVPAGVGPLTQWRTFTTVYDRNNQWRMYADGQLANSGQLAWNLGGNAGKKPLQQAWFLIDNSWGHVWVKSVKPQEVKASIFDGFAYEYDYTRVWTRATASEAKP